ncbi:MAG: ATP-binding protein [Myxococcota bacterium]
MSAKAKSLPVWKISAISSFFITVFFVVIGYLAYRSININVENSRRRRLEIQASSFATKIKNLIMTSKYEKIRELVDYRSFQSEIQVIVNKDVQVGSFSLDPEGAKDLFRKLDVEQVLSGKTLSGQKYLLSLDKKVDFVAVPISHYGVTRGAVILMEDNLFPAEKDLNKLYLTLFSSGLFFIFIITSGLLIFRRKWDNQVNILNKGLQKIARGNYDFRFKESEFADFTLVNREINRVLMQMGRIFSSISRRRLRLEMLLKNMMEAVIVLDQDGKIEIINQRCMDLLALEGKKSNYIGRELLEIIRVAQFNQFAKTLFQKEQGEILEFNYNIIGRQLVILARGKVMKNHDSSKKTGVILVLRDITRTRKLEKIRQDFVANVSHELKTPLTSIKGFLETVLSDESNLNGMQQRFLHKALSQSERLETILEDLLILSRLEMEAKTNQVHLEECQPIVIIEKALENNEQIIKEKTVTIEQNCTESLTVKVNRQLMIQALSNLINNALKYSPPQTTININCKIDSVRSLPPQIREKFPQAAEEVLVFSVKDQGEGMEKQYLDRIFERFYRISRSRTKKTGGTGLGLAIVKHIAHLHQGVVQVESVPGQGSHFQIILRRNS